MAAWHPRDSHATRLSAETPCDNSGAAMALLQYRAGARALERLRTHGFGPRDLRAFVLPATGPRWLVAAGLDRALLAQGWLHQPGQDVLLLGASAGAWRALALASQDPERTYSALIENYCSKHFTFDDDPRTISQAYVDLLSAVFSSADIEHALAHPTLDLALIAARARGATQLGRWAQYLALGSAALLNFANARAHELLFERTLFHARAGRPNAHSLVPSLTGSHCRLTVDNLHAVALASGSVPLYMEPVRNIKGATRGAYLDGGLSDYHLNQALEVRDGVALLFLHQPKVIAAWLDQFVPWRKSKAALLSDVLLVYPDPEFVRALPGGAVPSRNDFKTWVNDPQERFKRWRSAVSLSAALGDAFLEDVETGALVRRVEAV